MNDSMIFAARGLRLNRCAFIKHPLNFALRAGQWCVLTGDNGSGKTSLLRVLCGLSEPQQGVVHWQGSSITHHRERYHEAFIYIGHKLGFRGGLSVKENLEFYCDLRGKDGIGDIDDAIDYFGVASVAWRPYASLSQGQRQRAALCRLMIESAALWLLDEPTSALDMQGHDIFQRRLVKHLDAGGIAVVATHKPFDDDALQDARRLELKADV